MRYAILLLLLPVMASATGNKGVTQKQETRVEQTDVTNVQGTSYADGGNATQGINNSFNYDAPAPDIFMVPNNNTENCLRVFGLSFSNTNGGGGLGVPYRSKRCDYEQAADDAFAQGEMALGWFWKCQNSNLYGAFREKGQSRDDAKLACHAKMVGELDKTRQITELRQRIETLLVERQRDRELCNERTTRAIDACRAK